MYTFGRNIRRSHDLDTRLIATIAQDMWSLTGRASETNIRYEQTMQELEVGLYTFGPIGPFVEVCDADWKPSPGEGGYIRRQ